LVRSCHQGPDDWHNVSFIRVPQSSTCGQFDQVSEHSTNVSYLPLIELLERHPHIKVGLHYSGSLLEWLKQNHVDVIERLRVLVVRKQVEMITGGYYEPVLAALPDEQDRPDRKDELRSR